MQNFRTDAQCVQSGTLWQPLFAPPAYRLHLHPFIFVIAITKHFTITIKLNFISISSNRLIILSKFASLMLQHKHKRINHTVLLPVATSKANWLEGSLYDVIFIKLSLIGQRASRDDVISRANAHWLALKCGRSQATLGRSWSAAVSRHNSIVKIRTNKTKWYETKWYIQRNSCRLPN